jgi:hypothetical protein
MEGIRGEHLCGYRSLEGAAIVSQISLQDAYFNPHLSDELSGYPSLGLTKAQDMASSTAKAFPL